MAAMKMQTVAQRRDRKTGKAKGQQTAHEMIVITNRRDARQLSTTQLEDIFLQGVNSDTVPPHPFKYEASRELNRRERRRGRHIGLGIEVQFTSTYRDFRDRLRHARKIGLRYTEIVIDAIQETYHR